MARSINTLPSSVYRKNLIAAYSLREPPQIPIRKYIGRSITSQKIKNKKKSMETKTPIIPASRSKKRAKYPFTAFSIFHEANMQIKESNAVSMIIGALNPSTPI